MADELTPAMLHQLGAFIKNDGPNSGQIYLKCDSMGCNEVHPLIHEDLGEDGFATGRWPGWLYLDINRADLFARELRFCDARCLEWWLDRVKFNFGHIEPSALSEALAKPHDETARARLLKAVSG